MKTLCDMVSVTSVHLGQWWDHIVPPKSSLQLLRMPPIALQFYFIFCKNKQTNKKQEPPHPEASRGRTASENRISPFSPKPNLRRRTGAAHSGYSRGKK